MAARYCELRSLAGIFQLARQRRETPGAVIPRDGDEVVRGLCCFGKLAGLKMHSDLFDTRGKSLQHGRNQVQKCPGWQRVAQAIDLIEVELGFRLGRERCGRRGFVPLPRPTSLDTREPFQFQQQRIGVDRFRKIIVHAGFEECVSRPRHCVGRERDDEDTILGWRECANLFRGLHAVQLRHLDVH